MNNILFFLTKSGFFDEFNFDTLLALISCVAAIVALFVGGTAYSKSVKNKNSLNDSKQFDNHSNDYSQRSGGDIINNGITSSQLQIITNSMLDLTKANFSETLNNTYKLLHDEHERNLQNIIDETAKIIEQNKLNIAGYTKIDWINIYLENARITCDPYMQQIWAKVLAKELSQPCSISFKTIEVLKNMSFQEMKLLEKVSTISLNWVILKGEYLNEIGLEWTILQRMREYGLISLEASTRTIFFENNEGVQFINDQYLIKFERNENRDVKFECFILTSAAVELINLVNTVTPKETAIKLAKEMKQAINNYNVKIVLHKILGIEGNMYKYDDEDLMK